ncbi:4Fe-4S binding protein [candidate division KSB1 bacterium]|nr:4Fe-4S binding protein [candidate division KSB1 bacterium]
MKRKIIQIDEELCNGCGNCITGCSEGALALVNGKAKLVKENFCDGFGDCVGTCPTGALTIEEREADSFDVGAVKTHLLETQGIEAVWRMEEAQQKHVAVQQEQYDHIGCPGSLHRTLEAAEPAHSSAADDDFEGTQSELRQWPVHFRRVQPGAPFFKNKELVLMSTCGPLASARVHQRYLRGRSVIVGCPKLDDTCSYAAKLADILKETSIPGVIIARMEVPCCGGLTMIASQALDLSGRANIRLQEHIIGIDGSVKKVRQIAQVSDRKLPLPK